jgi:hypothetical protein
MANPIRFRKNINIGAADAESDDLYLENCFIDTGDLATLLDCDDPKCIILGRTGVGKSALIRQVSRSTHNVAELSPENLSLNYITNSNVLQFFEEAGVALDIFYQLLWRHIITVELLKLRFDITNEAKQKDFLASLSSLFLKDKVKDRAFKYLSDWGNKFWEETEYRTKEFTQKLESDLSASVNIDLSRIKFGAHSAQKISEEQKGEVRQRGMQVVNSVQVKELHQVIEFLAGDIFDDRQKKYYLVIDRLDEGWVDDRIRFKLIKALIETLRAFRKIEPVKIIIALRTDLYYRVIQETPNSGFQEEKYRSLYLPIKWSRTQIVQLLSERVNFMFERQYSNAAVGLDDILPSKRIEQRTPVDHIIDRTFFRPREAIIFLNECISKAEGQTGISLTILRQAESTYSQQRLVSLSEEWRREYPSLPMAFKLLEHRKTPFTIDNITHGECESFCEMIAAQANPKDDVIYRICEEAYTSNKIEKIKLVSRIMEIFYLIGLVGVKAETHLSRLWSFEDLPFLTHGQLKPGSSISVHKTFWAALGTIVPSKP